MILFHQCNLVLKIIHRPPFRVDSNVYRGGILVFVRKDIPSKHMLIKNSSIEGLSIKLNFTIKQWLVCCSYNLHRIYISDHLSSI